MSLKMTMFDTFKSLLRSAARALWHNPRITLSIWAVFSLGIGAVSAVFSVVEKVLLEPLPFPDPDRLVQLVTTSFHIGDESLASIPKYLAWHENSGLFESLAANDVDVPDMNLVERGEKRALKTSRVTAAYFHLFGAEFTSGRPFLDLEDSLSGPNVAILSNDAWQRYFHSELSLVGRGIILDDVSYKVIGILSPAAHLDPVADIWLPLRVDPHSTDPIGRVRVVARLREGISIAHSQRDLFEAIRNNPSLSLRAQYGDIFATGDSKLVPLRDAIVGDVRPSLYILLEAAGVGLAICCLNTGTLFLARASQKKREVAIRMAMGASRGRVVAELLTESLLLSLAGGVAGLLLGFVGVRELLAISPAELPRLGANGSSITLNWSVFLTALLISLLVGALCALAPALYSSREDFGVLLKQGVSDSGMALRGGRWRSTLIAVEISFSLVLLVGAGLLIRTFVAKRAISRGFDDKNVITVRVSVRN
jgi:predicted permease